MFFSRAKFYHRTAIVSIANSCSSFSAIPLSLFLFFNCLVGCTKKEGSRPQNNVNQEKRLHMMEWVPDPDQHLITSEMQSWADTLVSAWINDQRYRSPTDPQLYQSHKKEQAKLDAKNVEIVSEYLDKFGWPGKTPVGFKGRRAVAAVIQHAPLAIQEKYFPLLQTAYLEFRFLGEAYAMLQDRILVRQNKFQIFGTQLVNYHGEQAVYPVLDPDQLDYRRDTVSLFLDITNYLKGFGVKWDLAAYKKQLPGMVAYYGVSH